MLDWSKRECQVELEKVSVGYEVWEPVWLEPYEVASGERRLLATYRGPDGRTIEVRADAGDVAGRVVRKVICGETPNAAARRWWRGALRGLIRE